MKKLWIVLLLIASLFGGVLSGCSTLLKNEEMDQKVDDLIQALNEDDADRIFEALYPGMLTRDEFDASYETIRQIWEKCDEYTLKLSAIKTNKTFDKTGDSIIRSANYVVHTQNQDYTITLAYRSDQNGEGLYQFFVNVVPVLVSGDFTTVGKNSALQWGLLVLTILSYIIIIFTVVDILRKRPRLFGVWLGVALTFAFFKIQLVPGNFHVNGGITWFALSAFRIYTGGGRSFVFAVPAGAVVYWCLRRRLLARKADTRINGTV